MRNKIMIYDSTLRDGAQAEGVTFSVRDKISIVKKLDELGVDYIEAGNPGSNPKDLEFFKLAADITLNHAKLCAFGATHRVGAKVEEDSNIASLMSAQTPVVTIFGKCWDLHVKTILKTDLDTNIEIIKNTVSYFKSQGKEVVFDGEHFFDGYKHNPEYAVRCAVAATEAGADSIALCDTNGATFPDEVATITKLICAHIYPRPVAIHCHNDCGMAVGNTAMAVISGASIVQGTINGIGERCGNANLCTIIANLQLKKGYDVLVGDKIKKLTEVSLYISEIANFPHNNRQPYVGSSAFAHKGGMHIDGVIKEPKTFEHIDPALVGNKRRFLMSEMSGKANIIDSIKLVDPNLNKNSPHITNILNKLKDMEYDGYQFEGAQTSVELLIRKELGLYAPFFKLEHFKVISGEAPRDGYSSSAIVKVNVSGQYEITAAEGQGPVNALDKALRKVLEHFYPVLSNMHLTDYKVRVIDGKDATASKVRVLIESSDGINTWHTVGVSSDILEASWKALVDSIEYKLMLENCANQNLN